MPSVLMPSLPPGMPFSPVWLPSAHSGRLGSWKPTLTPTAASSQAPWHGHLTALPQGCVRSNSGEHHMIHYEVMTENVLL